MPLKHLPKSVAIIGAGPSGLFAARQFKKLGIKEITLFEKEKYVGGKCSTYIDPQNPTQKAERGAALIAPNYGEIIDILMEKGIKTEKILPLKKDNIELSLYFNQLNFLGKTKLKLQFLREIKKFNLAVKKYRQCCKQMKAVPPELEAPFAQFAKQHGLDHIISLIKYMVAGFGYGDMRDCPTYSVLEYMGYMTIPFLIAQQIGFESCDFRTIQGGSQSLMESLTDNINVITSARIEQIIRNGSHSTIRYAVDDGTLSARSLEAEALVLAVSPLHWPNLLGKNNLTATERQCVDQVTYNSYSVVICHLDKFPPNHVYIPEMFNKENFGRVAFVATHDKRENPVGGRLCSAYINQPSRHSREFNFYKETIDLKNVITDLQSIEGVSAVKIIECKIWEDYSPSIPWQMRLELEKQQYTPEKGTLYIGSYTLGSFEELACISNRIAYLINTLFGSGLPSSVSSFKKEISRFFYYIGFEFN